jgi:single-strand DNA-binding protein
LLIHFICAEGGLPIVYPFSAQGPPDCLVALGFSVLLIKTGAVMNKAIIIGKVDSKAKLFPLESGNVALFLTVTTEEDYAYADGTKFSKVEYHRITTFDRNAELGSFFLGIGSLVLIEGAIKTRKWKDRDGQTRYTTEIIATRVNPLDEAGIEKMEKALSTPGFFRPREEYSRIAKAIREKETAEFEKNKVETEKRIMKLREQTAMLKERRLKLFGKA